MLPKFFTCSISSEDIIALFLREGGIAFFDARTGNEIGSRIPTPDLQVSFYPIAFSPDGKWIAIEGDHKCALWNVETRTCVKTIEIKSEHLFDGITYSADGEKFMVVTCLPSDKFLLSIWDVETGRHLKQLEVQAAAIAISPDGSQIAIHDEFGTIKIIDVSTGHIDRQTTPCNDSLWTKIDPNPRIAWSPNGQFLASATANLKQSRTELNLLTRGSVQAPIRVLTRLECPTTKYVAHLAFSPDSSKVVAVLQDYKAPKTTLSIWCTRSGALVGTSHEMSIRFPTLSFAADGQDILICDYDPSMLYRFSVVPTHLETYMNDPPKFHPSQTPHTIQYSHHFSGAIDADYASHVTADGWILNTKGEREIWTPWANYELLCSCKPPQPEKGQTQYKTLKVKDPQTKTVVMIYVIAFEQGDVSNGF